MSSATFNLKQLTAAVSAAAAVAPTRTTKDVLKCLLIRLLGDHAELVATDSEISLTRTVACEQAGNPAAMLLDAAQLQRMLREMLAGARSDSVTLTASGTNVEIEAGMSYFRLAGSNPLDFPPVSISPPEEALILRTEVLTQLLQRTAFVADVESSRYALGGVMLEWDGLKLTAAATDSRRLAVASELASSEGFAPGACGPVPKRALQALVTTLQGGGNVCRIGRVKDTAIFATDAVRMSAQLISGRFPDWRKVLPARFEQSIDLVAGPFHSAVRQAQIMTSEESAGVSFTFEAGLLRLKSQAADVGTSKIELPISYDGLPLTINFDPRYLAEFLAKLEPSAAVRLELIDHESAALFSVGDEYRYLVMPLANE